MKTIWIFLVEFLQNIVNKILIFLEITLSKRHLPRLPRPHATASDFSSLQITLIGSNNKIIIDKTSLGRTPHWFFNNVLVRFFWMGTLHGTLYTIFKRCATHCWLDWIPLWGSKWALKVRRSQKSNLQRAKCVVCDVLILMELS